MIELLRAFLGYCQNCRQPKFVGEYQLFGWSYKFNLCLDCIEEQGKKLQAAKDPPLKGIL